MQTSIRGILAAAGLIAGSSVLASPVFAQESSTAGTTATATAPTPADAVAAAPAAPASPFTITGSAAIVSQYRFRGLAQSDNKPVVQGTFTVAHSSGFYVSTWGSSASAGASPINIGGTEIDVYGGYTHALGKSGFTIDSGVYGYIYPGAPNANIIELYGSLAKTYGPASLKAGINWAPAQHVFNYNFTSGTRYNIYVYGELGFGIPQTPLSFHSHLGHTGGGFDYGRDYIDYSAGLTYKWKSLAFDISIVGTDIGRKTVFNGFNCGAPGGCSPFGVVSGYGVNDYYRLAKSVAVGSITASF